MPWVRSLAVLTLMLMLAALTAPAVLAAPAADLPYRIGDDHRVVTDVFVNGQGPFNFLVDTASSRTLMFEHVRARLGLLPSAGGLLAVQGINAVGTAIPVRPDEVRLSGQTLHDMTLGVLPDIVGPPPDRDHDGVLGMDALSHYLVVLDRQTMRLKLLPPGQTREYAGWSAIAMTPLPLKNIPDALYTFESAMNGTRIVTLLDMGLGTTLINWKAAEAMGLHRKDYENLGPPPEKLRDALGNAGPAIFLTGVSIGLGSQAFANQGVVVSDAPVFRYFGLDRQAAAIVGPGMLQNNSLAIDFAGRELYVGPQMR